METPGETADYGDIDPWRVDRGREACERPLCAERRKTQSGQHFGTARTMEI